MIYAPIRNTYTATTINIIVNQIPRFYKETLQIGSGIIASPNSVRHMILPTPAQNTPFCKIGLVKLKDNTIGTLIFNRFHQSF